MALKTGGVCQQMVQNRDLKKKKKKFLYLKVLWSDLLYNYTYFSLYAFSNSAERMLQED